MDHQRQGVQTRLSRGAVASPPCGSAAPASPRGTARRDSGKRAGLSLAPGAGRSPGSASRGLCPPAAASTLAVPRALWIRSCPSWEGCCSRLSPAAPCGRGKPGWPEGSVAFHPHTLPEGFPPSGTQSDCFFPFLFYFLCFLLVVLFYSWVGLGLFPLSGTLGHFLLFPLLCSLAPGSRGCSGVGLLCLTC